MTFRHVIPIKDVTQVNPGMAFGFTNHVRSTDLKELLEGMRGANYISIAQRPLYRSGPGLAQCTLCLCAIKTLS